MLAQFHNPFSISFLEFKISINVRILISGIFVNKFRRAKVDAYSKKNGFRNLSQILLECRLIISKGMYFIPNANQALIVRSNAVIFLGNKLKE